LSERDDELELEALQRQLDDAFETTRPRRGFEDELWARMQRRRPFGERLRDVLGGLAAGFREAPAVPLGTLALLLIVVVGIGIVGPNLIHFSHSSATSANAPQAGAASIGDFYAPGGKVPTPALHPGLVPAQPEATVGAAPAPGIPTPGDLYFGPANLTWTGTFAADAVQAPVLIYSEPQPGQSDAAKGTFSNTSGVTVVTRGSVPQLPLEPTFVLSEQNPGAAPGADPTAAANAFLGAHNAIPAWAYSIVVIHRSGSPVRVLYERAFSVQNGDLAYLVDWSGERYGLTVDIDSAGRRTATGPLPLGLQNVSLPLISNPQAAQLALSEPPASTQAISPTPTVNLDKVELVYALAISRGNGFYEPAYLFSGQFAYNGQTYIKRVLVPLVVASSRS